MKPKSIHIQLSPRVTMEFVQVPAGRFWMGNRGGNLDEEPLHLVRIPEPFWIGRYPVTQREYQAVTRENPSCFKDDEKGRAGLGRPVEQVSWYDCLDFCRKWNESNPGHAFRLTLPSETQWEYACRAGSGTDYWSGDGVEALAEVGWFKGNENTQTRPVGEKAANPSPFGLHDTHGNVWEWCANNWEVKDVYSNSAQGQEAQLLPLAAHQASWRMPLRGGSWRVYPTACRSAYRHTYRQVARDILFGFRCVLFPTGSLPPDLALFTLPSIPAAARRRKPARKP